MQIRYKIAFTYAVTVAVILLLLCYSIYLLSAQDRTEQFYERLRARGLTIHRLIQNGELDPVLLKELVRAPSSALNQKSVSLFDQEGRLIFSDDDPGVSPMRVSVSRISHLKDHQSFSFKIGERDALAMRNGNTVIVIAAYDDDKVQWLAKLRLILFFSFVASVVLVLIVGYTLSLQLVGSIRRLSDQIKDISSGDLSLRLNYKSGKDELAELTATINSLLARLQHSFQTQSSFIDNASHELSTPLAVILSQLDVAKQKARSRDEYAELVDSVYEDVSRLDLLVKSLLDLAKVSGSQKGLELAYFRIDDLLTQLPLALRKVNPEYRVKLQFEEFPDDEEDMKVYGNEALLYCAFYNIVHNACKYTPDHAAVIKLAFRKGSIRVVVEDGGPGIEAEDVPHIFQPFYRSAGGNPSVSGTGLGLPLAKNIIKLHNGSIELRTEKDKGTRFIIELRRKSSESL